MPQIASIVAHDELDLTSLGEKKTALFAVIPDNDSSLNYIIGMVIAFGVAFTVSLLLKYKTDSE